MTDKERIADLELQLKEANKNNQIIMQINNQLRETMLELRRLIDATVK